MTHKLAFISLPLLVLVCHQVDATETGFETQSQPAESHVYNRDLDGDPSTSEAYYDTGLDASLLQWSGIALAPKMMWADAVALADGYTLGGRNNWRLPRHRPLNGVAFDLTFSNNGTTDIGYGAKNLGWVTDAGGPGAEIGNLFYNTLGNEGYCTPNGAGSSTSCIPQQGFGWSQGGPFSATNDQYWTETELDAASVLTFDLFDGSKLLATKVEEHLVWLVHDGDVGDQDGDGVWNSDDNCTLVANPSQCDSDGDGFGNHCDGDFDNNGVVNSFDLSFMRTNFGASVGDPFHAADLDCNGVVNTFDLSKLRSSFGTAPGPEGAYLACESDCWGQ